MACAKGEVVCAHEADARRTHPEDASMRDVAPGTQDVVLLSALALAPCVHARPYHLSDALLRKLQTQGARCTCSPGGERQHSTTDMFTAWHVQYHKSRGIRPPMEHFLGNMEALINSVAQMDPGFLCVLRT